MGIPSSIVSSGGIYTHKDSRNVSDVMHVNLEFPNFSTGYSQEAGKEKGMTMVYSANLGSQYSRTTAFMGHDATMKVSDSLTIYADGKSTKFKEKIMSEEMDPNVPIYQYDPSSGSLDRITSATAKYFAEKSPPGPTEMVKM